MNKALRQSSAAPRRKPASDVLLTQFKDNKPDARLGVAHAKPVSRFRPRYRQLSEAEIAQHDKIKDTAAKLEKLIDKLPQGRETSLAMTKLEEAVMWAVKGLTK